MTHRRPAVLALAVLLGACTLESPFARTNPFDSESDLGMVLTGPDSVHGVGQRFTLTIQAKQPVPVAHLYERWSSSSLGVLSVGDGVFEVRNAGPAYYPVSLSVQFDDVLLSKTVMIGQRP